MTLIRETTPTPTHDHATLYTITPNILKLFGQFNYVTQLKHDHSIITHLIRTEDLQMQYKMRFQNNNNNNNTLP